MAHGKQSRVYLGFEDEYVTEKHRSLVTFTTNKIGGTPDWPDDKTSLYSPLCRLCGLHQLLALQVYAPLENSKYHRTLYIFTCVNANCWNQNESWTCLRVQSLEEEQSKTLGSDSVTPAPTTLWLAEADDWGDNFNDNAMEQNGNNFVLNSNESDCTKKLNRDLSSDFADMKVDDPNANSPTSIESPIGGGAVGRLDSPLASAEIEGEESEVVCIDTPTEPQCDLIRLLNEVTPLPAQYAEYRGEKSLNFVETFLSVDVENLQEEDDDVPQHVQDLFLEYQQRDLKLLASATDDAWKSDPSEEKYEKSLPKHGDKLFQQFVNRVKKNPGQILRYTRDNQAALPICPLSGCIGRCQHCGDEMTFELQVLPTLIPKLKLNSQSEDHFRVEFGTVLVYTCTRSCWSPSDSHREEHVIVQTERL